jgi:hypothetical protein
VGTKIRFGKELHPGIFTSRARGISRLIEGGWGGLSGHAGRGRQSEKRATNQQSQ